MNDGFDTQQREVPLVAMGFTRARLIKLPWRGLPQCGKQGQTVKPPGYAGSMGPSKNRSPERSRQEPRTVGRTLQPIRIHQAPVEAVIRPSAAYGPADEVAPTTLPRTANRFLLRVANLSSGGRPGAYDLYLNLPPGARALDHPERYAGRISVYGPTSDLENRGRPVFDFVLDITRPYQRLTAETDWQDDGLRVTMVPVYDWSDEIEIREINLNIR